MASPHGKVYPRRRVLRRSPDTTEKTKMTKMKTLSVVLILSAAIATPVFAQDADVVAPSHARAHDRNYRGSYNQVNGSSYATPRTRDGSNVENFGFSARDPSRVGGQDPDLNPPS
jgi:hypothetical protein